MRRLCWYNNCFISCVHIYINQYVFVFCFLYSSPFYWSGIATLCMFLYGSPKRKVWGLFTGGLHPPSWVSSRTLASHFSHMKPSKSCTRVRIDRETSDYCQAVFRLWPVLFFERRENKEAPAIPTRTPGFRRLRRLDRTVRLLPSGCGTPAHADSRRHRMVVRHHSRDHACDCDPGGDRAWTVQRPKHELAEGADRCGGQLHHLRHQPQPAAQAAPDKLLHPLSLPRGRLTSVTRSGHLTCTHSISRICEQRLRCQKWAAEECW